MSNCFECRTTKNLHNHHVVPKSKGGTKTVPLCPKCHGLVHDANLVKSSELARQKHKEKKQRFERIGNIPYGYQVGKDKVTLIPSPKEQEILSFAITLRKVGLTYPEICKRMKEKNYRNRKRKLFSERGIQQLLNPRNTSP